MSPVEPTQDRIPYAEITLGLPAQRFGITCAISLEETLPVVNEFAIRLVHTCGSLKPSQLQTFFGFTERETTLVIRGLLDEKLVRWEDESLALTPYALGKFIESYDGIPRCVRIREWSGEASFELISYLPLDRRVSGTNLRVPVELSGEPEREGRSAYWAERSFQEEFHNIVPQQGRMQIYKISEMEPKERYLAPLSCTFFISLDGKADVTRSLPHRNMEDRSEIVQAISDVLGKNPPRSNSGIEEALRLFGAWENSEFAKRGGFDLARYLDLAHVAKLNPFGCDVTPLTGSLYLPENRRILKERLTLLAEIRREGAPRLTIYWLAPDVLFWGRSLSMRSQVWELRRIARGPAPVPEGEDEDENEWPEVRTFVPPGRITDRRSLRAYSDAVPHGVALRNPVLDGNVEILWAPDEFVAFLYHYHAEHAIPVPIGFFSSASDQLDAAKRLFVDYILNQGDSYELKNADSNKSKNVDEEMKNRRAALLGDDSKIDRSPVSKEPKPR